MSSFSQEQGGRKPTRNPERISKRASSFAIADHAKLVIPAGTEVGDMISEGLTLMDAAKRGLQELAMMMDSREGAPELIGGGLLFSLSYVLDLADKMVGAAQVAMNDHERGEVH